jgi:hypothetical protein
VAAALKKLLFVALLSAAANAHAPVATRTLRLQLREGKLEGLLVYHLPAQAARVFAAAEDAAVALTPKALAGLRLDADGAPLHPKVRRAKARALPDGALEAVLLIDAGSVARSLKVFVEQSPPMPVELIAGSGVKLLLEDGPGAPVPGGLALRPRPGAPCTVAIVTRGH